MNPNLAGQASPMKTSRPSLYTESVLMPGGSVVHGESILGGLESDRPRRKRIIGMVALAVICAIGVGYWQGDGLRWQSHAYVMDLSAKAGLGTSADNKTIQTESNLEDVTGTLLGAAAKNAADTVTAGAHTPAPVVNEAAPVEEAPVRPAASQLLAAVEGSKIAAENTTTPGGLPDDSAVTASRSMAGAGKGVDRREGRGVRATGVVPVKADVQAVPAMSASQNASVPDAAAQKAAGKPSESRTVDVKTARSATVRAGREEKDGDVELIAALLNRVSTRPEVNPEEKLHKQGQRPTAQRSSAAEQKKGKKSDNIRDISGQKPVEPLESQLKRCSSLSFLESELCRFRVCEGRWGKESACPEYFQASAALP